MSKIVNPPKKPKAIKLPQGRSVLREIIEHIDGRPEQRHGNPPKKRRVRG